MTRETTIAETVRLSATTWVALLAVVAGGLIPVIGGLISIKADAAAQRATIEAVQRQLDRLETRVK